jgi:hypothetical protein
MAGPGQDSTLQRDNTSQTVLFMVHPFADNCSTRANDLPGISESKEAVKYYL